MTCGLVSKPVIKMRKANGFNKSVLGDLIDRMIADRANEIRFYISEGIPKETAIEMVKNDTILRGEAWERVLALAFAEE